MNNVSDRVEYIRLEEKIYHDYCYDNYKLFEAGSWLHKPVKTVMDMMSYFENKENVKVLDLGSGVGRNSIPIAQRLTLDGTKVVCVDFLDSAIQKLKQYSKEHNVEHIIQPYKSDIKDFNILTYEYDFIVAVSSLEHVDTQESFENVLKRMENGTKVEGINCIIVNSEVEEFDADTGLKLDALMEVNISTEQMMQKLRKVYKDWTDISVLIKPLEYQITRQGKPVILKTKAITFAVQKK
ncbi:class I SAM-dependent methyltransferase [Pseudogracilibacillus auburnensis]|uniref:class I SAM-dependent methyltransferase n=1 Tax=Pseudogracilibacillus auburnensis TaxID=1494959 RepID=UPI001A96FBD6|nr:class I SAM-dependent methyltransferase [Pseudogracilibacillus auburnensis]MBO1004815.1 class I SAM-dependent methyltransferase [Pseudogracilibacillus auburnensis]